MGKTLDAATVNGGIDLFGGGAEEVMWRLFNVFAAPTDFDFWLTLNWLLIPT